VNFFIACNQNEQEIEFSTNTLTYQDPLNCFHMLSAAAVPTPCCLSFFITKNPEMSYTVESSEIGDPFCIKINPAIFLLI